MNTYLFGAVYVIEQDYTDEEILKDLKNMKNCGYNLVTLWPVSNPWLAKNSHEHCFDRTIKVLDICEHLGLKAILQLFGQNPSMEFMPDSALTPDMEVQDEFGPAINETRFWANLNHPTVREYVDMYFRMAIQALKDHPAVYAWDVFNEAHFRSDDSYTTGLYQQWLKKKYGNIQNLNFDWHRRYEAFSQVRPDKRSSVYSIWSSLLPELDYEKFRSVNLTDICRFLYDTAKKYDEDHLVIIDGTSSHILTDSLTLRNNDEFETAHVPDIYGATFYPKSWGRNYKNTPWTLALYLSVPAWAAHKAKKPYWVTELQTHTQSALTPGSEVTPEELRNWIMMCLFTGAQGFQLWRWRPFLHGYQITGRGLTYTDGTPNERSDSVAQLLEVIRRYECFKDFKITEPDVKIAFSYDVRLYFDALLKWKNSFWSKNLEGWFRLFWNNIPSIGFADISKFDDDDMKTPVIVLPGAMRISEAEARKLKEYVRRGGTLIADGRMGTMNDKAVAPAEGIPGKILGELFGFTEYDVTSGERFELDGTLIPAPYMSQKIKLLEKAEALAFMEGGTPAIVLNHVGKGKTLYFNSFLGLALYESRIPQIESLVLSQIGKVGGLKAEKNERVHLSCLDSGNRRLMLAINFSDEPQQVKLYLPANTLFSELFTGVERRSNETAEIVLEPGSCRVFSWEI